VRSVARAHDIPSNQLFHWRKLYREGLLGNQAEQATQSKLVSCPNDIVTNIRLSTSMLCDTISGVAIADNRTAGGVDAVGSVA
jgi:transposase-like protein